MTSRRSRGLPAQVSLPPDDDSMGPVPDERRNSQQRRLRPSAPSRFLDSAAQRRLLTLVAMLGLVLLLMDRARQPRYWRWIWSLDHAIPAEPDATAVGNSAERIAVETPLASPDAGWPNGLDSELLREVEDDRHFRATEQTAWFSLWRLLMETPSEELRRQSMGPVSYLQIATQTAAYRGRLVDMSGTIRRVYRVAAPANALGLESYTQCWFFPDSNGHQPIVLYVLDFPNEVPEAEDLVLRSELTAIVYKRWNYVSGQGMDVAPVVLAKDVVLHPPAGSVPPTRPERPVPLGLIAATAAGSLLTAALLFRFSGRRGRSSSDVSDLPERLPDPDGRVEASADEPAAEPR